MRIPIIEALKCSNARKELVAKRLSVQARWKHSIYDKFSEQKVVLCVAGLGEISGDEAAKPGWDQIRNNLICHAKEI